MIISELIEKLYRMKYLAGDIPVLIDNDGFYHKEFGIEIHDGYVLDRQNETDYLVISPDYEYEASK